MAVINDPGTPGFTARFDTDNAAFEDNRGDEIARIHAVIAAKVRDGFREGPVIDVNGNTIGRWEAT